LQTAVARELSLNAGEVIQALFKEHHGALLQAAYQITGNASQAEDALQTVFVRILKRSSSLEGIGRSYLKRAAINAALDIVRSRKISQTVSLEAVGDRLNERSAGPDQLYSASELRRWLRDAVSRLSPTAAEIFALRFFHDLSNSEIAELLGMSPGTVAVTLHRTRIRLQNEMESFYGEES